MTKRGVLILVVGPSGAGKDTLIAAARARRPDLHAPRRIVTRAAQPGDEPSCRLSEPAFEALRRSGRLALHWRAHGLRYGLRIEIAGRLAAGQSVLANVSRRVIPAAAARFSPCSVIVVTAPPAVLAARLAARGREDAGAIAARLARAAEPPTDRGALAGAPKVELAVVENAGDLASALARFMAALPPPGAAHAA